MYLLSIDDSITLGIIAVSLILMVLISIVVVVMLLARRQKMAQELLQAQTQNRLQEIQFSALRSQMNPHFIFNCLNSIKLFTEQNDSSGAALYLGKFSSLIRRTLDNARTERIVLEDELQSLQLYLELEVLRFKDKFGYSITVNDAVDKEFIEVPPLIIQPLAENAILHGLIHRPGGGGRLSVAIDYYNEEQTILKITVEDNGIGRKAAAALKRGHSADRISHGTGITRERLNLLNKDNGNTIEYFSTEDLYHADGSPAGTRVLLILPIK